MKLVVGCDHRGEETAARLVESLRERGLDMTTFFPDRGTRVTDYPDPAWLVARAVIDGFADLGVLICGSGVGMSIAANKIAGVRAALVQDELSAEIARAHADANVLCLPADLLGQRLIEKIIDVWLRTDFEGGRHQRRLNKINAIERGEDPRTLSD